MFEKGFLVGKLQDFMVHACDIQRNGKTLDSNNQKDEKVTS